ncbi:MAG: P1 family peptidase [Acidimicrobiales bacterium]|nr:P1 family peptidase [Acidimicrobiales bacterium]
MITAVPGLRVGHTTRTAAATGCTVVLFPEGTVASGEVRGGAPATREAALLDPTRMVGRLDALVLTGGSAFGLASADGVVRFCEERGMGFATPAGPVPIVVALGLFDLMVGDPSVRPGPDDGYAACVAATDGPIDTGRVGAGTGATVAGPAPASGAGPAPRRPGGLVTAAAQAGELVVAGLVAVNAAGEPGAPDTRAADAAVAAAGGSAGGLAGFGNTTVGLVATNASLDKTGCHLVAQGAHDGLARAVFPAHTRSDGDAFVAASVGGVAADVDVVRNLAVHVVARAVGSLAPGVGGDSGDDSGDGEPTAGSPDRGR